MIDSTDATDTVESLPVITDNDKPLKVTTPVRPGLSNAGIASASVGTVLRDSTVPGLHLRVTVKKRSYYLYYRTKSGIERRPKIGDHGVIFLQQAREIARDMLGVVAGGGDPVAARNKEKQALTTNESFERYMREHGDSKKTAEDCRRTYLRSIQPKFGKMRLVDITYNDVYAFHAGMKATPYSANRALQLLAAVCNYAERWGARPDNSNPCRHIKRYPEPHRRRYLTPEESKAIATELNKYTSTRPAAVAFIMLLILTGARCGEIETARWEYLKGNALNLPDSKTGRRTIYLPNQILLLLKTLPRTERGATRNNGTTRSSGTICNITTPYKFWEKIRADAGCPDLRLHDLRHSFASMALGAGYSLGQIGELLGHSNTQTTKRYAHLVDGAAIQAVADIANRIEASMSVRGQLAGDSDTANGSGEIEPKHG